jgi:CRISPR system Cascade subunit CasB
MNQELQKNRSVDYEELWAGIERWWLALQDRPGDRAELRRAHSPDEAALTPAYFALLKEIRPSGLSMTMQRTRMPIVAGVLAHVKQNRVNVPVAQSMGPENQDGKARISDLRFRRLLKTEDDTELYVMMIRMVRLLDEKVNVKDLAKSLTFWNERTRKEWAYLYYTGKALDVSSESDDSDSE